MSGIELISDQQVVKDLEIIKSLITCFHGIQDSVYQESTNENYHKTFLQIVHDSALLDPKNDRFCITKTHPVILDKRAALQYEINMEGGNPNRIRALQVDLMDIQKTIEKAEISLISAARSLACRIDEFLCLWINSRLPWSGVSDALKKAMDSPTMGYGKVLEAWQAELRRRCLVCPVP